MTYFPGLYALYIAILLLLYTTVPLPLHGTFFVGMLYSVLLETFLCLSMPERTEFAVTIIVNVLLHVCIHVIGIHTMITTQVKRDANDQ